MNDHYARIDWNVCGGEWVTREFPDKRRRGYVIAPIQTGLHNYIEKILPKIDAAYTSKNANREREIPLTIHEVDTLIFQCEK